MTISCSSSWCPSTSAWTSTLVRSSVGFSRRSSMSFLQRSKISGTSLAMTPSTPSGLRSGSPAPSVEFMSRAQTASSSGGMPMKLPITRATTGWATSSTRSHESRPSRRSSTVVAISRISSSWSAMRFGVKPAWKSALTRSCFGGAHPLEHPPGPPRLEERLDAVVLRRVHPDEHRARQLEREDDVDRRDAPGLGRVRLPVAADGVDVVGGRERPEALLGRVLRDRRGEVHRALGAQPLEDLVWRPVLPQLALGDEQLVQVALDRGHGTIVCAGSGG